MKFLDKYLFYLFSQKKEKDLIFMDFDFLILIVVVWIVRESKVFYLNYNAETVRPPGSLNNVFMTLMNSIHYFENNNFLYGETFVY